MAGASSAPFFGMSEEDHSEMKQQQQQISLNPSTAAAAGPQAAAPAKKKRNLPGTPNPDAEVIALSPKTLMTTNRFICEVCNKGFQREQNLQLHRRGHNLPWKLRQKNPKEVRRRVYLCPEPTCVHHDPSRALGDLTGIKKHFFRKHGEKKWKCDKCSKRYAVQSDWKAHSKTCGTREYRCDCGTLFSRRDSFITHRAFCDALAQESARLPTSLASLTSHHFYGSSPMGLGLNTSHLTSMQDQTHPSADLLRLGAASAAQFDPSTSFRPSPSAHPSPFFLSNSSQDFNQEDGSSTQSHHSIMQATKPYHGLMQLPDLHNNTTSSASPVFNLSFFSNGSSASPSNMMHEQFRNSGNSSHEPSTLFAGNMMNNHQLSSSAVSTLFNSSMQNHESVLPQMSATALLQKAAQMGATTSANGSGSSLLRGAFGSSASTASDGGAKDAAAFRTQMAAENETHLQDLMNSLANGSTGIFGGSLQGQEGGFVGGYNAELCRIDEAKFHHHHGLSNADGQTRDFLGVGSLHLRGMGGGISQRDQQQQHGIDHMGSLDSEVKSASRSFAGGSGLQQ